MVIIELIVAVPPEPGFTWYAVAEIVPEPETVPPVTVNVPYVGLLPLILKVPPVTVTFCPEAILLSWVVNWSVPPDTTVVPL